jgi:hypothetical protein
MERTMTQLDRRRFMQGIAGAGVASSLAMTGCGKPGQLMIITHGTVVPWAYEEYKGMGRKLVFYFPKVMDHVCVAGSFGRERLLVPGAEYLLEGMKDSGHKTKDYFDSIKDTERPILHPRRNGGDFYQAQSGVDHVVSTLVAPIPMEVRGLRYFRFNPQCCSGRKLFSDNYSDLVKSDLTQAFLVHIFVYDTDGTPWLARDGTTFWQDASVRNLHLFDEPQVPMGPPCDVSGHFGDVESTLFMPRDNAGHIIQPRVKFADQVYKLIADPPKGKHEWGIDDDEVKSLDERGQGLPVGAQATCMDAKTSGQLPSTPDPSGCMAPFVPCQD